MPEFNLLINDPSVPVSKLVSLPVIDEDWPKYFVDGFTGNAGEPGTPEYQAIAVWSFITHTLSMFQKYLPAHITKWATARILSAVPRAGRQLNAFYDRQGLKFYYETNPVTKKVIFLCESSDVVCHEFGHACLDAVRPDIWSNAAIEVSAFHESFADCVAILSTLNHPEMVSYVISETKGNMRITNSVSKIAEEMGACLAAMYPNAARPADFLRNAINPFRYTDPADLPNSGPDSKLTREGHSFSRVFTGAFYDALAGVYEFLVSSGTPNEEALTQATDICGTCLLHGVSAANLSPKFYESVAISMIGAAFKMKISGFKEMVMAFIGRGVINSAVIPLSTSEEGEMDVEKIHNLPQVIKLSDYVSGDNPLYKVEVEIPSEQVFCMSVENTERTEEAIKATKEGLDHLAATDKVCYHIHGSGAHEFRVENGKLVRNHVSCW